MASRIPCPGCGRPKPAFAIVEGRCDSCALDEARAARLAAGNPRPAQTWGDIRAERTRRLAASDWTQAADSPLDAAARAAWAVYRQALRDVTETFATPADVAWPSSPTAPPA